MSGDLDTMVVVHRFAIILLASCGFSAEVRGTEPDMGPDKPLPGEDAMNGEEAGGGGGGGSTIDLVSVADTFLRQQFPTELHGGDTNQRCGSGDPANCCTNRAVYRFDLSTVPIACVITNAELRSYYYAQDYTDSPTLNAHRVTSNWVEGQASWNARATGTAWTTAGGDYDPTAAASVVATAGAYGWLTWNLTTLAQAWRAGTLLNHGVLVVEPGDLAGADRGRKFFRTRESSITAERPHLRVTCQ